jgi:hypothetical protein
VNAFNLWALLGSGDTPPLAFTGVGTWARDSVPLVGPLRGVTIGSTLLALGFLLGVARLLWRTDLWSIVLVGAYLSMCFFMLPTRVHERYLVTAFAFLPLLAAFDRKWLWATVALTIGLFMNLHGVLTTHDYGTANVRSLPLGEFSGSTPGILISISLHTAVFLFAAWSLRPGAKRFHTLSHAFTQQLLRKNSAA